MESWNHTAQSIVSNIKNNEISAEEITKNALDRLDKVNPSINAVVDRFDDEALFEAKQIDLKINSGEAVGVLAGVPVTVKVNVDQIGRSTTNGLKLQKNNIALEDNPVVANLRKAGAIIIGRTNTPAFSLRWFTRNSLWSHKKPFKLHNNTRWLVRWSRGLCCRRYWCNWPWYGYCRFDKVSSLCLWCPRIATVFWAYSST